MYTLAEIKELKEMGFTNDEIVKMSGKPARKGTGKAAPEKQEWVKANGETVMATQKQIDRWTKLREEAPDRKAKFEELKAEYEAKHAAYKPSDELIAAIKADRAAVTRKVAADKYGFVGTKKELAELKAKVLAK